MNKVQELIQEAKNSPEYWEDLTQMEFVTFLNEEVQNQEKTQKQIADELGVSKSYVSRVLSGEKANFTLKSMIKFMFVLGRHLCFLSEPIKNKPVRTFNELLPMIFVEASDRQETIMLSEIGTGNPKTLSEESLAA